MFSRVEQAVSFSTVADRRLMLESVERPEIDIWSDEGEGKTRKRKKEENCDGKESDKRCNGSVQTRIITRKNEKWQIGEERSFGDSKQGFSNSQL